MNNFRYLFIMLLLSIIPVFANAYIFGDLEGYIYDQTGLPKSDVTVKIVSKNLWTLTDFRGYYSFKNLPIGEYQVEVQYKDESEPIYETVTIKPMDITFYSNSIHYYNSADYPVDPVKLKKPKPRIRIITKQKNKSKVETSHEKLINEREKYQFIPKDPYGDLKGRIKDKYQNPVRFASVNIIELEMELEADYEGSYYVEDIEPGIYTVLVKKEGYESRRFIGVLISAGEVTLKNVTLRKKG